MKIEVTVNADAFDSVLTRMMTPPRKKQKKPKPTYTNAEFTIKQLCNTYNRFAYPNSEINGTSLPKKKKIAISEDTLCSNCKKEKCYPYSTCRNCREERTVKASLNSLVRSGDIYKTIDGRGIKGGARYKTTALGDARYKERQKAK